jgi:hypothetical protein
MSVVDLWLAFTEKFQKEKSGAEEYITDSPFQSPDPCYLNSLPASLSQAEQEDFQERAAIMEFEGKLSPEEAEREALRIVLAKQLLN